MCDDWDDLIEFVVQKFLRSYQTGDGCSKNCTPSGVSVQDQNEGNPRTMGETHEGGAVGGDDSMTSLDIEGLKCRLKDSGECECRSKR